MSKEKSFEDGVWRTVGGRRIFIRNGQGLAEAMRESGKFAVKEKPSIKYNSDVNFICKIRGKKEIEAEFGKLKNYDVVLTNERKEHIFSRRGKKDYDIIMENLESTLKYYQELYCDSKGNRKGVCFIKPISSNKYCAIMVSLSLSEKNRANSNITGIVFNEDNYIRYTQNRKILDKKE